jgi:hypothetical protein
MKGYSYQTVLNEWNGPQLGCNSMVCALILVLSWRRDGVREGKKSGLRAFYEPQSVFE